MRVAGLICFIIHFLSVSAATINSKNYDSRDAVITVKPKDIVYFFCSQNNPEGTPIKFDEAKSAKSIFNTKKETLIQIHGWFDKNTSAFNSAVKNATLSNFDINIIIADWSKVAIGEYLIVKTQIKSVGKYIGEFVANLTSTFKYPASNIKIVGHSLGAHIAGFVGKSFNGTIDEIVGIDPAGPFISTKADQRLDKNDAKFVQVIHTSSGSLGMGSTIGHADYFPNGGIKQPGCGIDLTGKCAHLRSFWLYAESLTKNGFYAEKCSTYKDFEDHKCTGTISLMGGYNVDRKASGVYYLDTNDKSPYAKGKI